MRHPDIAAEHRRIVRLLTAVAALLALRLMTSEEFAALVMRVLKGE